VIGRIFLYIKNLFLSDSRSGLAIAMIISIIPARKHAISGIIDQKTEKSGRAKKVIFIKNSIRTQSNPTAIKQLPAI
jgi:hypothetical protein